MCTPKIGEILGEARAEDHSHFKKFLHRHMSTQYIFWKAESHLHLFVLITLKVAFEFLALKLVINRFSVKCGRLMCVEIISSQFAAAVRFLRLCSNNICEIKYWIWGGVSTRDLNLHSYNIRHGNFHVITQWPLRAPSDIQPNSFASSSLQRSDVRPSRHQACMVLWRVGNSVQLYFIIFMQSESYTRLMKVVQIDRNDDDIINHELPSLIRKVDDRIPMHCCLWMCNRMPSG